MLNQIWILVETVGGVLSVGFVGILAVALFCFAAIYLLAALGVLARFAHSAQRLSGIGLSGALVCALAAGLWIRSDRPDLSSAETVVWFEAWAKVFGIAALGCVVSIFVMKRGLQSNWLGRIFFFGCLPPVLGWLTLAFLGEPDAVPVTLSVALGWGGLLVLGLLPLAAAGLAEIRRRAEWFIAIRYLVAERRQVFISAITVICIGAVAAGVWLIITVLSVMNGFERTWREEVVGNYAHFLVRSHYGDVVDYPTVRRSILSVEGVVAAAPYLDAEGMVRSADGRVAPLRLRGIDVENIASVTEILDALTAGSLDDLVRSADDDRSPGLLIGSALAEKMEVKIGDSLVAISPVGGAPTPMGAAPRLMRFEVVGLFESSFLQFDELYAYTTVAAAQSFLGLTDVVTGFEVKSEDIYRSRQIADAVENELGPPFYSRDWKEIFPGIFHALNDNRTLMFMLLVMIMVVSAFVIVVTLMMMIMAKSTDIAVLKTLGASDRSIELIFAIEGALIGVAGVAVGVGMGIVVASQLAWIQEKIEAVTGIDTLPASVYQISTLPAEVDPLQVFGVASIALVLAFGATLLPSRHGARLDPVEGLREE